MLAEFDLAQLLQQVRESDDDVGTIGMRGTGSSPPEVFDAEVKGPAAEGPLGGIDIVGVLEEVTAAQDDVLTDELTPLESVLACIRECSSTADTTPAEVPTVSPLPAVPVQPAPEATPAPHSVSRPDEIPNDTCSSASSQVVSFDTDAPVWEYRAHEGNWLGYYSWAELEDWVASGVGGLHASTLVRCTLLNVEATFGAVNNGDVVINSTEVMTHVGGHIDARTGAGVNPNALPWQPVGKPVPEWGGAVLNEPVAPVPQVAQVQQQVPQQAWAKQLPQRAEPQRAPRAPPSDAWAAGELVKLLKNNPQLQSYVPPHVVAGHLATLNTAEDVREFLLAELGSHPAVGGFFESYCECRWPGAHFTPTQAPVPAPPAAVVSPVTASFVPPRNASFGKRQPFHPAARKGKLPNNNGNGNINNVNNGNSNNSNNVSNGNNSNKHPQFSRYAFPAPPAEGLVY